ncbi:MAG TPA: LuxR C-terminal-related transcriptional regulator [Acidimicrobiales bacterium]|nr:LuxR C-terminal-related transcriptional regulator [Acidimicrobiales bacterium]
MPKLPNLGSGSRSRPASADWSHQLLAVVAVWDGPFSADDAAALLGEPVASLLPDLESLVDAGVLCYDGDRLAFADKAERQARVAELPEPLRTALHRRGEVRRGQPAPPAVEHRSRSSRPGQGEDRVEPAVALRRAASESPVSGAKGARRALGLRAQGDDHRGARSVAATTALLASGRVDEASELAQQGVADLDDREAVAQLRLIRSTIFLMACRWDEATAQTRAVLSEPGLPDRIHGEAMLAQLRSFMSQGNELGMRALVASIMKGDRAVNEDVALGGAFVVNAQWAWDSGRPADAVAFLRAAIERADRGLRQMLSGHPRLLLAAVLACIGDGAEARLLIAHSAGSIRRTSDTLWAPAIAIQSAQLALAEGRLDDAVELAETGLRESDEQGTLYFSSMAWSVLAMVALHSGDLPKASTAVARGVAGSPPDIGFYGGAAIAKARARVVEARGFPEQAMAALSATCREPVRLHRMLLEDPMAAPWWVRVALAGDNRSLAGEIVLTIEHLARFSDEFPSLLASAAHARGLFSGEPLAVQAASLGHIHPWARASAAEDAGRLAGSLDRPLARSCLQEARAGYNGIGAVRDADRVERSLRRLERGGPRGRSGDRPVSGWGSLTDTERRVALTVAEGRTNLEAAASLHLSRHTVDFHLRHIFRKLDIASRVELAWSVANHQH